MRNVLTCGVAFLLAAMPVVASAQQAEAPRTTRLIISDRAIAAGLAAVPPPAVQRNSDSVSNGLVIGALIGGLATAAFLGYVCTVYKEPNDPPCWKTIAVPTLLGVGVGAAAGAGIDALSHRPPRQFPLVERRQPQ